MKLLRKRILKIKVLKCQLKLALTTLLGNSHIQITLPLIAYCKVAGLIGHTCAVYGTFKSCFYNLFTSAEGHGNPTNGIFGIPPPSIAEYFYSANHDLLIPLPQPLNEDDNFGAEPEGNQLYYHLV